jgi:hypothetical protein
MYMVGDGGKGLRGMSENVEDRHGIGPPFPFIHTHSLLSFFLFGLTPLSRDGFIRC